MKKYCVALLILGIPCIALGLPLQQGLTHGENESRGDVDTYEFTAVPGELVFLKIDLYQSMFSINGSSRYGRTENLIYTVPSTSNNVKVSKSNSNYTGPYVLSFCKPSSFNVSDVFDGHATVNKLLPKVSLSYLNFMEKSAKYHSSD